MLGDLNANIGQNQNPCSHLVADLLMEFGLADLLHHFQRRWRFRHMKIWLQVRRGILLRTKYNYILGTDMRQFKMVEIGDVQNYSSDHFALQDRLL